MASLTPELSRLVVIDTVWGHTGVLFFKPSEEDSTSNILFPKSWWGVKFYRRCICSGRNQEILRRVVCQGEQLEYVDDSQFRSSVANSGQFISTGFVHPVYLRWRVPVSRSLLFALITLDGICSLQNQPTEGRSDWDKCEPRMISRVARRKPRCSNLETSSQLITCFFKVIYPKSGGWISVKINWLQRLVSDLMFDPIPV